MPRNCGASHCCVSLSRLEHARVDAGAMLSAAPTTVDQPSPLAAAVSMPVGALSRTAHPQQRSPERPVGPLPMPHHYLITFGTALLALICAPVMRAADRVDFSRDIQPLLSDNCYACHGPDAKQRKAKLRLDTKEGAFRI